MSEEIKPGKKLKTGVRIKTKPAVVPTRRKVKTKGAKLPIAMMGPKGIRKWNIIFTIIFGALLVLTVINSFFREFIIIPIPDLYLQVIIPIVIFIEVFLVLLAFETYKVSFAFRLLRIILTIITALVFFPLTLIKYHTRHNIWRIMFVGLTIGTLILSFFSPYINMIGKYRDLPPGDITEQEVSPDWFSSLFQGSAPFYIDGLLDLLDALDLNDTLGDQEMATVDSSTALGNYLYRWEINDRYDSGTWEFTASNAQQFSLEPEDFGSPPAAWVQELNVTQTVYSSAFSTAILGPLLSTWSTYHTPHLEPVSDYDSYLRDSNDSVAAESGSTSISFNSRDQLLLQSTATSIAFLGTYNYQTYFALDDIQAVIGDVEDHSLDGFGTTTFNDTYAAYLQEPQNYRTVSPSVATYATTRKNEGFVANSNTVYEQIIFVLDDIIQRFGLPLEAQSDNEGADRAERLILGYDRSVSAYIALAVMALRICGIPARPVFGFAIGDDIGGDPTSKSLTLANLFGWVEALL
ncbi:MAG: transglutaminase domain-containing protein, partial [Candidatus Heimdallarchaeota archaeon]|nr:transglutaminase domain-containing protein [Candidatus Heimdallarchaeota archaeon]MCK4954193.1 transglutaminase domain-containing protein [Candidatus Heimdallarchaeota archaeon]